MSIRKSTEVWATTTTGRGVGWIYTIAEMELFLAEAREAGVKENERVIKADSIGQIHLKVNR